jgi:hypothetical protein
MVIAAAPAARHSAGKSDDGAEEAGTPTQRKLPPKPREDRAEG